MLKNFVNWLDVEIKELARFPEQSSMWNKYTEARRIRDTFRQMVNIEDITGEICDRYCRFPEAYDSEERMREEKCEKCPLNKLVG